jgi:5-methylcytosine-specific restriction endonuclease McrA
MAEFPLRQRLRDLRKREQATLMEILTALREVDRLRLFVDFGYKSLFEYLVKELSYSEAEAYHRINALRLTKELPQIEDEIKQGTLSLTSLTVAGTLFRAKKMTADRKMEVLREMRGKSRRESEAIAREYSGRPKDREVKMTMRPELEDKIAKVKGLLAHSHPEISTAELFEKLCDGFLEQHEKKMKPRALQGGKAALTTSKRKQRFIPIHLKRAIWQRDNGRCTNCGSQHALEYDHIRPLAHNGETSIKNLRLLCRKCNQRAAILKLGPTVMEKYLWVKSGAD